MTTYNLTSPGDSERVAIEVAVPADWAVHTLSKPDAPQFKLPGSLHLGFTAIPSRLERAISAQYDDAEGAERTDLPDGRVWMVRREANQSLHARMFVPHDGGTAMGVAILAEEGAALLPAIKQVFETLKVAGK